MALALLCFSIVILAAFLLRIVLDAFDGNWWGCLWFSFGSVVAALVIRDNWRAWSLARMTSGSTV